ncbi:PIN domain-containing protein [Geodermatophilus sp. SYSU D01180]
MAFVVVYDANVLYPNALRDLLIRVAQAGMVQAKWTHQILDETFRNMQKNMEDITPEKIEILRTRMLAAIRDVLVRGHEPLIDALDLPDPDDRHVLAAAIKARAQTIVTFNLKDFPEDRLAPWQVEAQHPDQFVHDLIDLKKTTVFGEVQRMADSTKNPPLTVDEVLSRLSRCGLVESVDALRS